MQVLSSFGLIVVLFLNASYLLRAFSQSSPSRRQCTSTTNKHEDVSIVGLASMGKALLECLSRRQQQQQQQQHVMQIHAWTPGQEQRQAVQDLPNVALYSTFSEAVGASTTCFFFVDDWAESFKLIQSLARKQWEKKTLVLFSSYTPSHIKKLEQWFCQELGVDVCLVGGALIAVPQTVCSEQALILTTKELPILSGIGKTIPFIGDVGLAALANTGIIQSIIFGMAGHELSTLMFRKYGVNEEFQEAYINFAAEIIPVYMKMLMPEASDAIMSKNYGEYSYISSAAFRRVLEMQLDFMQDLGIAEDIFVKGYLKYLERIPSPRDGPAAWVEQAIISDKKLQKE